jgi:hypothetical protein
MARYPQSQSRPVMAQKAEIARQLLARGLTVQQIRVQLGCSYDFVRRIARQMTSTPASGTVGTQAEETRD